ncbi:hypothetical protein [Bdellovibrio svalbardensis]|uniref:Type II secretion system protein GspC N-terminal domain-containing protein n=1 Tax=Bdellovibrio svalbardensis TaxID=2972972 RepID=A0ABT6DF47_9BACT|nr:hypothetical protein [Bdellovibrio svalbardensis]MDG0815457.1 hypothetical protein [Bdellovibrio svalbardensis]
MEKIRQLKLDTKIYLAAFLLLGVISMMMSLQKKEENPAPQAPDVPNSVDTFIPRGFVLVPIELANAESLSSLVGDLGGVVDLYLPGAEKKRNVKVAARIKLLRAPLNPNQYAVLIKESDSSRLLSVTGPFIAVVQNPDSKGTEIAESKKSSVRIDYQN